VSRRIAIAAAVLALWAGACVPPVEETTTPVHFNPETVMGQIQERGELKIGLPVDRPPFAKQYPGLGHVEGLAVDLGAYVADAMHVEPHYVEASNDELLAMIDDKAVDLAFPITTITESLVRHYSFTDPYWVAHQRVLSFDGRYSPGELAGATVCSFIDPETEVALDDLDPDIDLESVTTPADCVTPLAKGRPATASDAVLMGMLGSLTEQSDAGPPTIGGDDLTTEGYGAVVIGDAPGFIEVVNNILQRAKDDGTWQRAAAKWTDVYDELDRSTEPPDLTVEEAAALYPAGT
jgi:polar amino acid transport system substrate-binding protein